VTRNAAATHSLVTDDFIEKSEYKKIVKTGDSVVMNFMNICLAG